MADLVNDALVAFGLIVLTIVFYILAPVILASIFGRLFLKVLVVTFVYYFIGEVSDYLLVLLSSYMPTGSTIMALACQLGLFEGLDLFMQIVLTVWGSKLLIFAIIAG